MARRNVEHSSASRTEASLQALRGERVATMRQLMRVAEFDPRRVMAEDGCPLRLAELPQDVAAVLQSVEIVREVIDGAAGETIIRETYRYSFADKVGALSVLADMLGLIGADRFIEAPAQ